MIKRITESCIVVSSSLIQLHPIGPLSVIFSVLLVEASLENHSTLLTYVEFSVTKSVHPPSLNTPTLIWLGMLILQRMGVSSNGVPPKKKGKMQKCIRFFFFISLTGCLFSTPLNSALSDKGFPRGY